MLELRHEKRRGQDWIDAEKGPTCAAFLLRAAPYFASFGITRIERVMTPDEPTAMNMSAEYI